MNQACAKGCSDWLAGSAAGGQVVLRCVRRRANRAQRVAQWAVWAVALGAAAPLVAQDDEFERLTVIRAAKVITVSGEEIERGVVVIAGSKIQNVGKELEYPRNARVIDARDQVVMPAFVYPYSRYGLPNYSREGVHGNYLAADEQRATEASYELLRRGGFSVIGIYPGGTGIPGRGMVLKTGGTAAATPLAEQSFLRIAPDFKTLRAALEKAQQEIEKVDKARKEFEQKQSSAATQPAASQPASQPAGGAAPTTQPAATQPTSAPASQPAFQPPAIDPAYQALVDLIQRKAGMFALAEMRNASDYLHYADLTKKTPLEGGLVLLNTIVSDFDRVAAALGEKKARVVCFPQINRVPASAERNPIVLHLSRLGCEVSVAPLAAASSEFDRLLQRVADLVREGWPRADALKSLTLHPARLLRLDGRLGTLEQGRDADIVFLSADPFAPGCQVRRLMIEGEIVHE